MFMPTFKTSSSKEAILKKIRTAIEDHRADMPYPDMGKVDYEQIYTPLSHEDLPTAFAAAFTKAGGKFVFCANVHELIAQLNGLVSFHNWKEVACAHKDLFTFLANNKISYIRDLDPTQDHYDACITDCEVAIARTGSFIFSSMQNYGRTAPIYYPIHIVVVQPHQIVKDIGDGLRMTKQKYQQETPSMINLNTGPSRTADIEKTLVTGVHGPKEIYCFWLEN
jgi:L-lactate dehydrogenase complex protein LldG